MWRRRPSGQRGTWLARNMLWKCNTTLRRFYKSEKLKTWESNDAKKKKKWKPWYYVLYDSIISFATIYESFKRNRCALIFFLSGRNVKTENWVFIVAEMIYWYSTPLVFSTLNTVFRGPQWKALCFLVLASEIYLLYLCTVLLLPKKKIDYARLFLHAPISVRCCCCCHSGSWRWQAAGYRTLCSLVDHCIFVDTYPEFLIFFPPVDADCFSYLHVERCSVLRTECVHCFLLFYLIQHCVILFFFVSYLPCQ